MHKGQLVVWIIPVLFIALAACFAYMDKVSRKLKDTKLFLECERAASENFKHRWQMLQGEIERSKTEAKVVSDAINSIQGVTSELRAERDKWKLRAMEVEEQIEGKFGVSVRQENTIIKADFDKVEMVTMFAGLMKLMKDAKGLDDINYYTALLTKMQGFIDRMTEDQETSKS